MSDEPKSQLCELDTALGTLERSLELYKNKQISAGELEDSYKSVESKMTNRVQASRKTKFNNLKKQRQEVVKQIEEDKMVDKIRENSKKLDQILKDLKTQRYVDVVKIAQKSDPIIEEINQIIKFLNSQEMNLKIKKIILDADATINNFAVSLANLAYIAKSSSNEDDVQYQASLLSIAEQIAEEEEKPKEQKVSVSEHKVSFFEPKVSILEQSKLSIQEPREISTFSIVSTKSKKKKYTQEFDPRSSEVIGMNYGRTSYESTQRPIQTQVTTVQIQKSFFQKIYQSLLKMTSCGVCDQDEVESIQGKIKN